MRTNPTEMSGFEPELATAEAGGPKSVLPLVPGFVLTEELTGACDEDERVIPESLNSASEDSVNETMEEGAIEIEEKTDEQAIAADRERQGQDLVFVSSTELPGRLAMRAFRRRGGRRRPGGCSSCKSSTAESFPVSHTMSSAGCNACQSQPAGQIISTTAAA